MGATDLRQGSDVERLRAAYIRFRERAAGLARQIEQDLPDFTVHDVTHLDALWSLADLIAGPEVSLNPAEGFVLGGAILLHDLGMSVAAYPHGIDNLQNHAMWADTVAAVLRENLGRTPKPKEIASPGKEATRIATQKLLRELHAQRANQLASMSWRDFATGETYHLLEEQDLRQDDGTVIGKIAHSHWLPVSDLSDEFPEVMGLPGSLPSHWTIDPLKLACLLRTADAAHLDERRAPRFLRTLRNPTGIAAQHWSFQAKLNQPTRQSDRLLFTAHTPFGPSDADAWWLCFDALRAVDRELRDVDDLLADLGRQRLAAAGVRGVDSAKRLARLVPTNDWLPIDASVQITDVQALIRNLGGESLYGNNRTIPLRELIQNAADAVRARRRIDSRAEDWGEVTVTLGHDGHGDWIDVLDTGVGMSVEALSGVLLDFGKSGWNSDLILKTFPTLLSRGFEPTEKFGIGFFSVFMWGDRVCVTSRRYDAALRDTHRLEFSSGLSARPLLRRCTAPECLRDGGTSVRVWLRMSARDGGGLLGSSEKRSLGQFCASLAPSLDVNLFVATDSEPRAIAVAAHDWRHIDPADLVSRILWERVPKSQTDMKTTFVADVIRSINNDTGECLGRACITPQHGSRRHYVTGVVTVGGLRSETALSQVCGILLGHSLTASRLVAEPEVHGVLLAQWSEEQARLLAARSELSLIEKAECAEAVRMFGGDTGLLPIAESCSGWVTCVDIASMKGLPDEIILLQDAAFSLMQREAYRRGAGQLEFLPGVFCVSKGQPGIMQTGLFRQRVEWPETSGDCEWADWGFHKFTLVGAVLQSIAKAWDVKLIDVLRKSLQSTDEIEYKRSVVRRLDGKILKEVVDIIRKP